MTTVRDAGVATGQQARRLRFDRYVLDLDRGCLLLDEAEIALRPKTFATLRHLVENCGRLVSKDELFAAVWPDVAVTDDALVQSIGELRRALGNDGARLIKTIPRRGYRLDADMSVAAATVDGQDVPPAVADAPLRPPERVVRTPLGLMLLAAAVGALVGIANALWSGISPGPTSAERPAAADQQTNRRVAATKPSIAILPFVNQSDDPTRDYFADGLTQDVINALGRFSELTVMSWNAVLPYKGKPASPGEVARGLAVRYQVEGGVRQIGDRLRLTAQLVDTDGRVLWSARFDEPLLDIFALQDKITTEIAGALAIRVSRAEQSRVLAKPTDSLEAYDYVLRARPASQRPTRANNVEARTLLRRAVELDPNYAAAHAALAESYYVAVSMGWAQSPTAFFERAEEFANKALSLNEAEVRAHIVLGRIHIFYQRYDQAKAELDRAIAINPNVEALELAQRIDPELNPIDGFALSLAYYLQQRYETAIAQAETNLRRTDGANFSRVVLAAAYAQLGRTTDAERIVAVIRRADPTFDARDFGTKFLNSADLERLRDGLRKADLYVSNSGVPAPDNGR
jgi:adenylate cyclase